MNKEQIWEDIWVHSVPGPAHFIRSVVESVEENLTVALELPLHLPWGEELRSEIKQMLKETMVRRDILVEELDFSRLKDFGDDIGLFLLEKYADRGVFNSYRSGGNKTIQAFLSQNQVFTNRILWVKGLDAKQEKLWLDFLGKYPKNKNNYERFILELTHGGTFRCSLNYENFITPYDIQLFLSLLLKEQFPSLSPAWQQYIATVISCLADKDPELACELAWKAPDFLVSDPISLLEECCDDSFLENRLEDEKHVLYALKNGDRSKVETKMWTAQVQTIFPLIELERKRWVQNKERILTEILNLNRIYQFGQVVTDVMELEIGTITGELLMHKQGPRSALLVLGSSDYDWVHFLRKVRNNLAHGDYISPEKVGLLLKRDNYS